MKLLIMRHGEATPLVDSDANRALTAWGVEQAKNAARTLVEKGHRPDLLLVSPLLRAQQTASEVTKEAYNKPSMVNQETLAILSPESSVENLVSYLGQRFEQSLEQRGETEIMLVSHQPLVSLLIAFFSGEQVGMSTANVALVELNSWKRLSGDLKWVI
ncbi:MAG: phosphohistidine phosphatase [Candidatus Azotimanducaceae bacterium]|jgi:phosphohistidine phosphatase